MIDKRNVESLVDVPMEYYVLQITTARSNYIKQAVFLAKRIKQHLDVHNHCNFRPIPNSTKLIPNFLIRFRN